MILLDTHVLLWSRAGDALLGPGAREAIDDAWRQGELAASAVTFFEAAMLHERGRFSLAGDVDQWRRTLLDEGLTEIPTTGAIATRATALADPPGDWVDRIIVATALDGHTLLTADPRLLDWPGDIETLDARA